MSEERQALSVNRDLFRSRVGSTYNYDYRNVCFCVTEVTREVHISIRNGLRVSVIDVEDDSPISRASWGNYLSVEEVFDTIQRAFDERAAVIRVDYDESLGFPRDVYIDFDERIADEERGFTISRLTVAP